MCEQGDDISEGRVMVFASCRHSTPRPRRRPSERAWLSRQTQLRSQTDVGAWTRRNTQQQVVRRSPLSERARASPANASLPAPARGHRRHRCRPSIARLRPVQRPLRTSPVSWLQKCGDRCHALRPRGQRLPCRRYVVAAELAGLNLLAAGTGDGVRRGGAARSRPSECTAPSGRQQSNWSARRAAMQSPGRTSRCVGVRLVSTAVRVERDRKPDTWARSTPVPAIPSPSIASLTAASRPTMGRRQCRAPDQSPAIGQATRSPSRRSLLSLHLRQADGRAPRVGLLAGGLRSCDAVGVGAVPGASASIRRP